MKLLPFLLVILLYVLSKVLFNNDADVTSGFSANTTLYLNAFFSLLILTSILIMKKNIFILKNFSLYKIVFYYYLFAFLSFSYSGIMLLTLYNSIIGILYVIASMVLGEKLINNYETLELEFEKLMIFLSWFSLIGIFANVYFYMHFIGIYNFVQHGIPSGFITVFVLYLSFILFIYKSNNKKKFLAILLFILAIFLKSFSAYLSLFIMIMSYLLLKKKYIIFILVVIGIVFMAMAFISYLESHIGTIVFNKPAEAYLSGSGRFALYQTAINIYLNEFTILNKIFGIGFMADRSVLVGHDLPWITDPHNALVLNFLGLGMVGVLFYIIFLIYPFIFYKKIKKFIYLKKITIFWLCFHVMAMSYSLTSSYYLGRPSILLLISLTFYYIIHVNYYKILNKAII